MNILPFSKQTKRIPIWGLGCAGGASGIARAFEYCKAFPKAHVLVIAAELCSLTFQKDDQSKSNLIGTSLFGDGIAALLMCGKEADISSAGLEVLPEVVSSQSATLEDSEDVMGWEINDNGFRVVFSRDIPTLIKTHLKNDVEAFLNREQLALENIQVFLAHPGGKSSRRLYSKPRLFRSAHRLFTKNFGQARQYVISHCDACFKRILPAWQSHTGKIRSLRGARPGLFIGAAAFEMDKKRVTDTCFGQF